MRKLYPGVYATPFHSRTAAHNIYNAWTERGMFTVPQHFGNVTREALAARFSAVMADITPLGRLRVYGRGAARLLSAAFRTEIAAMPAGEARRVFWTADNGGVRGSGIVARYGEENFLLEARDTDKEWFSAAASRFGAGVRDESAEKGVLLIAGPYAAPILAAAGLQDAAKLRVLTHAICDLSGVSVTVARRPPHGGFELSCSRDSGLILFDRLYAAGHPFGLTLLGQDALELLYLESGIPISGLDYTPARELTASEPAPATLGLARSSESTNILAGVEWEGPNAAAFTPLYRGSVEVGQTLRSAYSPALRRTIALANLRSDSTSPGTELTFHPFSAPSENRLRVCVVPLPFLSL